MLAVSKNRDYFILLVLFFVPLCGSAQGVCRIILNQNFGEGLVNPGAPFAAGKTTYTYSNDSCPATGSYAIVNSLFRCVSTRIGRSLDKTPSSNGQVSALKDPPAVQYVIQNSIKFYNTRLIVKDAAGCTDTAYHTTTIASSYIAVLPGFAANGDGKNDYLYPLNAYKQPILFFGFITGMGD